MLQPYATDELLAGVKRDCFIATSDENWGDSRILGVAHDQILKIIAPQLKTIKEGWFRTAGSITLVANDQTYDVPEEAMWNGVETVHLRSRTTGQLVGNPLVLITPSNAAAWSSQTTGIPAAYYIDNTQLNVFPAPNASAVTAYDLQVTYYRRPAQMIVTTDACNLVSAASVTAVTTTQPAYFITNAPDVYTSGAPYVIDAWSRTAPYTRKFARLTASSSGATNLVFNGAVTVAQVATLVAGDVLTVHGTSIFPDLPPEIHPFLRDLTSYTIKLAQGDKGAQDMMATTQSAMVATIRGMSNRADGQARKLSLFNSGAAQTMVRRGYRRS